MVLLHIPAHHSSNFTNLPTSTEHSYIIMNSRDTMYRPRWPRTRSAEELKRQEEQAKFQATYVALKAAFEKLNDYSLSQRHATPGPFRQQRPEVKDASPRRRTEEMERKVVEMKAAFFKLQTVQRIVAQRQNVERSTTQGQPAHPQAPRSQTAERQAVCRVSTPGTEASRPRIRISAVENDAHLKNESLRKPKLPQNRAHSKEPSIAGSAKHASVNTCSDRESQA
jgi:hypothetical protein